LGLGTGFFLSFTTGRPAEVSLLDCCFCDTSQCLSIAATGTNVRTCYGFWCRACARRPVSALRWGRVQSAFALAAAPLIRFCCSKGGREGRVLVISFRYYCLPVLLTVLSSSERSLSRSLLFLRTQTIATPVQSHLADQQASLVAFRVALLDLYCRMTAQ